MRVWGESAALLEEAGLDAGALGDLERTVEEWSALPRDLDIVDAHVHLGVDADGHRMMPEDLVADLERHGCAAAACFPANAPGPDGLFAEANDAVAAAARRWPDRIIPFCRVDPRRPDAIDELERAAAAGARGLKLHPVAQRFRPEDPAVALLVRAAAARGWPVVIHAGFGARALAAPIRALTDAVPEATLILAHGGRGDARALRALLTGRPGILFDTSLATLADLVETPPHRLCFGSDRPYGEHATALHLVARAAAVAGWSEEELRGVLGGNLRRLLGE